MTLKITLIFFGVLNYLVFEDHIEPQLIQIRVG